MRWHRTLREPGVVAAMTAAALFGAGTPLAKMLLHSVSPWLMAGLLYLGSGIGMVLVRRFTQAPAVVLPKADRLWLLGAVLCGGVLAPVLLMFGLSGMPASDASLLLNAEGVFTALLAWFVFKENFDRRIALGMVAIVAGALILSWPKQLHFTALWPSLALLAACFAWGLDNNFTRKVSLTDATWIAATKGLVAGAVNLSIALVLGASLPPPVQTVAALVLGFAAYGASLALFVVALRHLGTARTGAYFSVAPFFGAVLALLLGEPLTTPLLVAGAFMALGVWLHLSESHEHPHRHDAMAHDHEHDHIDAHHQHAHEPPLSPGTRHRHAHEHAPLSHTHPHYPDAHHPHRHD